MKRTGKNNLIYLMALILVIIAFIAFATYGMLDGSKDEEWYPVSVIVENSSSDRFTSFREGLERDIVVSLDNDRTEQAVDYLQAQEQTEFGLYGIGCSEKNVYYLDKGVIGALVVPNEFNIGYLSAAAIAGQLREPLSSAKTEKVGFLTITKDNLYDEENQKILFPIVQ